MTTSSDQPHQRNGRADERVSLHPLNPVDALRGLLKVDPAAVPAEPNGKPAKRAAKPKK